jgi:hypothetical protein
MAVWSGSSAPHLTPLLVLNDADVIEARMKRSFQTEPCFKKLPVGSQFIVFPLILSLLMSGVVSTIATLMVVGLEWSALPKILRSWAFSYVIAFPASVLVMPVVRRIVSVIVENPNV